MPRYIDFRAGLPHTGSGKIATSDLRSETRIHGKVYDRAATPDAPKH